MFQGIPLLFFQSLGFCFWQAENQYTQDCQAIHPGNGVEVHQKTCSSPAAPYRPQRYCLGMFWIGTIPRKANVSNQALMPLYPHQVTDSGNSEKRTFRCFPAWPAHVSDKDPDSLPREIPERIAVKHLRGFVGALSLSQKCLQHLNQNRLILQGINSSIARMSASCPYSEHDVPYISTWPPARAFSGNQCEIACFPNQLLSHKMHGSIFGLKLLLHLWVKRPPRIGDLSRDFFVTGILFFCSTKLWRPVTIVEYISLPFH